MKIDLLVPMLQRWNLPLYMLYAFPSRRWGREKFIERYLLMNIFTNLLNSGVELDKNDKKKYKINFINFILLFSIILYLVFIPINLIFYERFITAYAEIFFFIINLVGLIYLRKTLEYEKVAYIILIFPLINYAVTLTHHGSIYQSGFYWFFLYPIFAMLLKSNKEGPYWVGLQLLMLLYWYFHITLSNIDTGYNPNLLLILLFALILETAVVMYYEKTRKRYAKIIVNQNKILSEHGKKLEYKVIAQEQEIIDIQRDIIFTMGSIGERRSKETANHVKRVAGYSQHFASLLNFEQDEIDMIYQASPMHDIGKVAIADNILNKPAKLTPDEFEQMKLHSTIGFDMLKGSNRPLLQMAATIAQQHHERWDGSGYPNGLIGKNIHIYARITAIADVFDALGSKRVYKEAWDDKRIFARLKEQKSKHFDPVLVDLFFENLDKFLEIREKYKDIY